jgi:hypothetical protein
MMLIPRRRIRRVRLAGALLLAVPLTLLLACSEERTTEPSILTCEIDWQMTIVAAGSQLPIAGARIWIPDLAGGVPVERTLAHTDAAGKARFILELTLASNVPQPIQPFVKVNASADGFHTAEPQETVGRCEQTALAGVYSLQPCQPGEFCI